MNKFTAIIGIALACLALGAQAQKPTDKMGKMKMGQTASATASIVEGTVTGAPNGKMFTIQTSTGSMSVDASKGARFRNRKGRFEKSEMLTAGSTVKIKGMKSGGTLMAKDVEITSLDASPSKAVMAPVGKKPGRKPKMDKMAPVPDKMAPPTDKMAPVTTTTPKPKRIRKPKVDKMAPATDKMAPGTDKMAPATDKMAPGADKTKKPRKTRKPKKDKMAPGTDKMAPGSDKMSPGTDGKKP